MSLPVYLYSSKTLQEWDPDTPWRTGIGGSETGHIEMHNSLWRKFYGITSFAPLPRQRTLENSFPEWFNSKKLPKNNPALIINYRDFALYDQDFAPGTKHWFIAQDVDYPWTEERLAKIDRYITLCTDHSKFTLHKYPQLKGRVFQSSNGIRSTYIESLWENPPERRMNQVIYASSPDRGLQLLLEQWFRVRERVPNAELKIAYGFENTNKIIELMGGKSAHHEGFRDTLTQLFEQPGVEWLGRLPQDKLYQEWFRSNVWAYPCNFAETSCITCMDAQACGAVPVTNNLWAVGENVNADFGIVLPATPQSDILVRSEFIELLISELKYPTFDDTRREMAGFALEKFNWDRIADQWLTWIKEDIK